MRIATKPKRVVIALAVAFVLLIGWAVPRRNAPPFRLFRIGNDVVIDVQTLGEYPTTVNRIRLSELNRAKIVWEVKTQHGTPQIHEFSLKADENFPALEPQYGDYRTVVPNGEGRFILRKGTKYRIEVLTGSVLTKRSATFSFAELPEEPSVEKSGYAQAPWVGSGRYRPTRTIELIPGPNRVHFLMLGIPVIDHRCFSEIRQLNASQTECYGWRSLGVDCFGL